MNLKTEPPDNWYNSIAMCLLSPYILKWVQTSNIWCHKVINMAEPKYSWFSVKTTAKMENFAKTKSRYWNFTRFLAYKEENDISNIHSTIRFKTIQAKNLPPFFFHQNDHKGCLIDHLDGQGHFPFGFGATGKKFSRGVVTQVGVVNEG